MFLPEPKVRIWLYRQPTDMRKSFNGLCALVSNELKDNPTSGQLFVFINRCKTHIKVLYFLMARGFVSGSNVLSKDNSIIVTPVKQNNYWAGRSSNYCWRD